MLRRVARVLNAHVRVVFEPEKKVAGNRVAEQSDKYRATRRTKKAPDRSARSFTRRGVQFVVPRSLSNSPILIGGCRTADVLPMVVSCRDRYEKGLRHDQLVCLHRRRRNQAARLSLIHSRLRLRDTNRLRHRKVAATSSIPTSC